MKNILEVLDSCAEEFSFPVLDNGYVYLAENYRGLVLCTQDEVRVSVLPSMDLLLPLDEWRHPDISGGELPSSSEDFKNIAIALDKGSFDSFQVSGETNTHWRNWPEAGKL